MSKCDIFGSLNLLSKRIKIKPDLPFERLNVLTLQSGAWAAWLPSCMAALAGI